MVRSHPDRQFFIMDVAVPISAYPELIAYVEAIKAEVGAESVKDMGRVMALLKERHGTQLDMSKASGLVKAALS